MDEICEIGESSRSITAESPLIINDNEPPLKPRLAKVTVKERVKSLFPILSWLPQYTIATFFQDLLAGFTVGLTEIPQGIAYAAVAGLPTQYGLYSGIMGGATYFVFGGCKDINMGPTAIMALFIQKSVTTMGPAGSVLICFLSGVLIFLAGILHLGFIVEFVSFPVISSFTTAAALSIACSQLKPLFGIKGASSAFLEAWKELFEDFGQLRKWDTVLGFVTIASLFAFREIKRFGSLKHKPEWSRNRNIIGKCIFFASLGGNALAVIAGTSIAYVAENSYNATPFLLTGSVASGLPNFTLPPFSTTWNGTYFSFQDMLTQYGTLIAVCPMVAFLEHIAIVKVFTKGKTIDATQELLALGIGNMAGSLVQSMPVTGSFTRTAVNNASGVKTTAAGLITCLMLLVCLSLLTGVFKFIPKASLAGVIMVSMYYLCEFHAIWVLWKTKKLDLIPYFVTLLCALFISLESGIVIGVVVNMVFILYESARPKLYFEKTMVHDQTVYIIRPKVGLHFTSAEYLRDQVLGRCQEEKSVIVIDGEFVRNIDGTIANSFRDLADGLEFRNQQIVFWNFNQSVIDVCTGDNRKMVESFRSGSLEDAVIGSARRLSAIALSITHES